MDLFSRIVIKITKLDGRMGIEPVKKESDIGMGPTKRTGPGHSIQRTAGPQMDTPTLIGPSWLAIK